MKFLLPICYIFHKTIVYFLTKHFDIQGVLAYPHPRERFTLTLLVTKN
jgi:hypothetical protein